METQGVKAQQGDSAHLEPGASLREAREAAGLSVKDVAEQLNLLVSHVEALETNDFQRFNAKLFARGYVRSYARLFQLNDAELLLATNRRLSAMTDKSGSSNTVKTPSAKPYVKVIAALIVAVLVWTMVVVLDRYSHARDIHVEQLSGLIDPLPFEVVTPLGAELLKRANGDMDMQSEVSDEEIHLARLVLDFTENSWIQIKNAHGDILFSGLQKKGEHMELSAEAPMEIILAYWPGVSLHFNGQLIDLSQYTSGNAVRLRLFES